MVQHAPFLPGLSPVGGKPVHVAFDGGRLTSNAGVLVLGEIERKLGIAERLTRCIEDPRDPQRVSHSLAEMIRFRALLVAAGYPADRGSDSRFVVTNLRGAPRWLYEEVYCSHGQAENLIMAHKLHLASERTSCTKATANQFRLLVRTAAYWLLHTLRHLAPKASFWRDAQFDTIRMAPIKIAGRVTELVTRLKVALPSCYPHKDSLSLLSARAAKLPP